MMLTLKTHKNTLLLLSFFLIAKAAWAIYSIKSGYISLAPDEAQYWNWSQNLDFGFYSKPPGIAWQIWLGCKMFGQTELGVRFFAVVLTTFVALVTYFMAHLCKLKPLTCFWSAMIFAFSPIGFMGTFAATTDLGFILFWSLSLCPILWALSNQSSPNYILVGLCIFAGALFKWPIYGLWPLILLSFVFYKKLYNKSFYIGVAISLLGFLPSIIWNYSHEWATFKHVFTQTTSRASKGNFWDFFGAQIGILSPIFFGILFLAFYQLIKRRKTASKSLLYSAYITFFILGIFLAFSIIKKMQPNWALFAYPTSTVLIAWCATEVLIKGSLWLKRGLALSCFMVMTLISIPYLQTHSQHMAKVLPYKLNPFRQSSGWANLKEELTQLDYTSEENFFCSDSYQVTSLLGFYGPKQNREYFLNVSDRRKNQFSFWPSLAQEKNGKSGYFVYADNAKDFLGNIEHRKENMLKKISPYFEHVEVVKVVPLYTVNNKVVKGAIIFKCTNYNGEAPQDKSVY